jgi:hypothetical protein
LEPYLLSGNRVVLRDSTTKFQPSQNYVTGTILDLRYSILDNNSCTELALYLQVTAIKSIDKTTSQMIPEDSIVDFLNGKEVEVVIGSNTFLIKTI